MNSTTTMARRALAASKTTPAERAAKSGPELVTLYDRAIVGMCRKWVPDPDELDDLVQTVRMRLLDRHHELRTSDAINLNAVIVTWIGWQIRAEAQRLRRQARLAPIAQSIDPMFALGNPDGNQEAGMLEASPTPTGAWGTAEWMESRVDVGFVFRDATGQERKVLAMRMLGYDASEVAAASQPTTGEAVQVLDGVLALKPQWTRANVADPIDGRAGLATMLKRRDRQLVAGC